MKIILTTLLGTLGFITGLSAGPNTEISGGITDDRVWPTENKNYIAIRGGHNWFSTKNRDAGVFQSSFELDNEWNLGVAYGRQITSWFRAEFEFQTFTGEVGAFNGATGIQFPASGRETTFAFMFNGIFEWKNSTKFTPFVGAGIGPALVTLDKTFTVLGVPGVGAFRTNDSDLVLAGQALAGVAYEISDSWTLELLYRFFATTDQTFSQRGGVITSVRVSNPYSHAINVGIRYGF